MRRFVAPGKIVLLGEYAVLDGAPALVAAIDRGVRCHVAPADALSWTTPGDDRFVAAALAAAHAPAARYAFADARPAGTSTKAGFGGSAAATVVATLAARTLADDAPSAHALCDAATAVHRAVQGSGSGVDVAASAHGGVIRFQHGRATPAGGPLPRIVWSGRSARTGPRVARYQAWGADARRAFADRTASIVDAWSTDPIAALDAAWHALCAMAAACDLDYRTPELDRVVALARECGGAAKPSGAGGGDCAIALLPDPDADAAFAAAIAADPVLHGIDAQLARGACEEEPP